MSVNDSRPPQVVERQSRILPKAVQPPAPVIETLPVNIADGLVNASLPYLLTSSPPPVSSTPWGLVTLAGLAFFAVGAAVALGAVNAMRAPVILHSPAAIGIPAPPSAPVAIPPRSAVNTRFQAPVLAPVETSEPVKVALPPQAKTTKPKTRRVIQKKRRKKRSKATTPASSGDNLPFDKMPF